MQVVKHASEGLTLDRCLQKSKTRVQFTGQRELMSCKKIKETKKTTLWFSIFEIFFIVRNVIVNVNSQNLHLILFPEN